MIAVAPAKDQETITVSKQLLLVFSSPTEGDDDAYNEFFNKVHLPEMVATPGVVTAQRFRVKPPEAAAGLPGQYVAIYEIEGDLEAVKAAIVGGRDDRAPLPPTVVSPRSYWVVAASDLITE
jgi:hypothetical protein